MNRRTGTILAAAVLALGAGLLLLTRALSADDERATPQIHAARPSPALPSAAITPPIDVPAPPAEAPVADTLPSAAAPASSHAPAKANVGVQAAKSPNAQATGVKPPSVAPRDKVVRGASGLSDFGGRLY